MPSGTSFHFSLPIRIARIIPALLVLGCFFLSHPYGGVRHDGILYLGEALYRLDPARMSQDLFFAFGSQASFTVVPHVYAFAIASLGIASAAMLLLVVSLLAYVVAAWWVAKVLVPPALLAPTLLAVSLLAPIYGGHRVFAYAETFFTARSFAEPIVLLAVGLAVRGRVARACLALLVAGFMHPLIALPGCLVVWCGLVIRDRRWSWAALTSIVPIALAWLGVAPFDGLLKRYDSQWLAVVRNASPFVFTLAWSPSDWATVVFDVGVGAFVIRERAMLGNSIASLLEAGLLAMVIGIGGSILGADVANNVLLTGLQLWRVHWLVHWLSIVAFVPLFWSLWVRNAPNDRAVALLFGASALSLASFGPLVFIPAAFALGRWTDRFHSTPLVIRALAALCAALAVVLTTRQMDVLGIFSRGWPTADWSSVGRLLGVTVMLVAISFVVLRLVPRRPAVAACATLLLLLVAVASWDQRSRWTRYQERYTDGAQPLWSDIVRAGDRVFWHGELGAPWLMMRHANYYSANQAAGVLFNRETAMAIEERGKLTATLEFQETVCQLMNGLNQSALSCEPDMTVAQDICRAADSLSFVVLQSALPVVAPVGSLDTGIVERKLERRYLLYRCSDLLAARSSPAR